MNYKTPLLTYGLADLLGYEDENGFFEVYLDGFYLTDMGWILEDDDAVVLHILTAPEPGYTPISDPDFRRYERMDNLLSQYVDDAPLELYVKATVYRPAGEYNE